MKTISAIINRFIRYLTGYTFKKAILNDTPELLLKEYALQSYSAGGAYYRFPRNCQIPGLSPMLEGIFGRIPNGIFLEIGAYDGFNYSNSWGLLMRGWTGILVEPVPEYFEILRANTITFSNAYPFNFAIVNSIDAEEVTIQRMGPYSSLKEDSINQVMNAEWYGGDEKIESIQVPAIYGRKFLEVANIPDNIELLIIDVEGYELEVLESLDLGTFRPKVIICEISEDISMDHKHVANFWDNKVHALISDSGYRCIFHDAINSIFLLIS